MKGVPAAAATLLSANSAAGFSLAGAASSESSRAPSPPHGPGPKLSAYTHARLLRNFGQCALSECTHKGAHTLQVRHASCLCLGKRAIPVHSEQRSAQVMHGIKLLLCFVWAGRHTYSVFMATPPTPKDDSALLDSMDNVCPCSAAGYWKGYPLAHCVPATVFPATSSCPDWHLLATKRLRHEISLHTFEVCWGGGGGWGSGSEGDPGPFYAHGLTA